MAGDHAAETLALARGAFDDRDYATALGLLMPLAESGDAEAQTLVGVMYRTGLLGMSDLDEAAAWFEAAVAQGHAEAQFNLGLMYFHHETLPPGAPATNAASYEAAFAQFTGAARQGHAQAQLYLGHLYAEGLGVAADRAEAYMWYQLAAWQRSSLAAAARDRLVAAMTAAELARAKELARAFNPQPLHQGD